MAPRGIVAPPASGQRWQDAASGYSHAETWAALRGCEGSESMPFEESRPVDELTVPRWRRVALHTGSVLLAALGSLSWRHSVAAQATPTRTAPNDGLLLVQSFS